MLYGKILYLGKKIFKFSDLIIYWKNLIFCQLFRITEKDYVVVRKAFELLMCLCSTCGTFLKKRMLDEIFPKLSLVLTNLAIESELVKEKNRKYYTYTQSYKLQHAILKVSSF